MFHSFLSKFLHIELLYLTVPDKKYDSGQSQEYKRNDKAFPAGCRYDNCPEAALRARRLSQDNVTVGNLTIKNQIYAEMSNQPAKASSIGIFVLGYPTKSKISPVSTLLDNLMKQSLMDEKIFSIELDSETGGGFMHGGHNDAKLIVWLPDVMDTSSSLINI